MPPGGPCDRFMSSRLPVAVMLTSPKFVVKFEATTRRMVAPELRFR